MDNKHLLPDDLNEDQLLRLAAYPELWEEDSEPYINRLKGLVLEHKKTLLEGDNKSHYIAYLLKLIILCPLLLDQPYGFEWVKRDFRKALSTYQNDFWKALELVKKELKGRGRPKGSQSDKERLKALFEKKRKGMTISKAVAEIAEEESYNRNNGKGVDDRSVWRSKAKTEILWKKSKPLKRFPTKKNESK